MRNVLFYIVMFSYGHTCVGRNTIPDTREHEYYDSGLQSQGFLDLKINIKVG